MKRITVIILYLITCVHITGVCARDSTSIPIKILNHRTLVPVTIGQMRSLDILLDTGMPFDGLLIYNPDLTDSIQLNQPMKIRVGGAGKGDPATALMDSAARFRIGDVEFTGQKMLLLQNDMYKGFPSDGVLGYSLFGHYAVEIDYDNREIKLHEFENLNVDQSWNAIPIYFKNNTIPWIDVSVVVEDEDPCSLSTYIDFAAAETIELLEKDEMKFPLPDHLEDVYLGRGLSGDIYGKKGQIARLVIGKYVLNKIYAAVVPEKIRSKQKNADAVIGSGSLSHFNLIFDYQHKKLFLKPNSFYTTEN